MYALSGVIPSIANQDTAKGTLGSAFPTDLRRLSAVYQAGRIRAAAPQPYFQII